MSDIDALLAACRALAAETHDPARVRQHALTLQEGLAELCDKLAELREVNRDLNARRESLEQQVMDMANEPLERLWENVLLLWDEPPDDEDDFDGVPEPAA